MSVGIRMKELRKKQGLTIEQSAQKLGISRSTMKRLEAVANESFFIKDVVL